jgi:hypothetical protein
VIAVADHASFRRPLEKLRERIHKAKKSSDGEHAGSHGHEVKDDRAR